MRRRGPRALAFCAVTATLIAGVPAVQGQAAARATTTVPAARTAVGQRPTTVTLITGDRVTLHPGDRVSVTPGPGRAGMTFLDQQIKGHRYVIPADALPLLKADRVDRRLFDVTALRGFGYDDRVKELPLLVSYAGGAARTSKRQRADTARAATTVAGTRVVRDLPVVDALALRADRSGRAGLWHSLTSGVSKRSLSPGLAKIWLDGKRTINLDVSVPQIGAPTAWKAGFDGTGVKVAVLDTGVDATHPDLAGRIAASANFTEAPDADDDFGHGTHVASIIAGSGAASGGRYRGVAPGAKLLIGKVCDGPECADSAVIAGMQWAVEQGAQVVNLSLSGPDSPGVDPLEQAVEDLTAASGALFVAAAGNDGADATVGSPASADAALAVGAVDRSDRLATFSSRGPRIGDDALKPEITAPGVEIVAAKAAHGDIGDPAPVDGYVTMSGTSMATPHVAGAAAILTQKHPGWSAAQRKSGLMASAKPTAGLGVFSQGAGRVDVARAITQTVTVDTPAVSFGRQVWPHGDDPTIAKTVTYRNSGTAPVTLALSAKATGPAGAASPAGVFTLGARSLTVPAGGTAAVTLKADTRVDGSDGYYGGYLTATAAGGVRVQTPFAVTREVESYDVTLVHTNRDGTPATSYLTMLFDFDRLAVFTFTGAEATATKIRLPKGRYGVYSFISTGRDSEDRADDTSTMLIQPALTVDATTTLRLDARRARPVSVTVPHADARPAGVAFTAEWPRLVYESPMAARLVSTGFEGQFTGQIVPAAAVDGFTSSVNVSFARPAADGTFLNSPYIYDLMWFSRGSMLSTLRRTVKDEDLATIHARYARQTENVRGVRRAYGVPPGAGPQGTGSGVPFDLPLRRTEYVNTDGGLTWMTQFDEADGRAGDGEDDDAPVLTSTLDEAVRYRPRHSYDTLWNAAVFGPSVTNVPSTTPELWASRLGDSVFAAMPLFGDGQGHSGESETTVARTALYRNGALVAENPDWVGEFTVPAGRAGYRLEASAERGAPSVLSTKVQAAWTFTSTHVAGEKPERLPLSTVRFTPPVNELNTAPVARTVDVGVTVDRLAGSSAAANRALSVQISFDDGRTWTQAPVKGTSGHQTVSVAHPGAAGFVSLRAKATDTQGNTVAQTVIRAYRIG